MTGYHVEMRKVQFAHGGDDSGFTFDVVFEAGKITALMGASGGGKSTLLNLLAGFLQPATGSIFVGDSSVTRKHASDRPVSMIFQDHNLFAHLTVEQNVGLGISPGLALRQEDKHRIAEALKSVGLDGYAHRKPSKLSGGERQRVALARILVRDRPILLMDEALASLGPGLRQSILDLVLKLRNAKSLTVIMVTHDPSDARRIADNVVFLADKGVIGHGPMKEILLSPSDPRIAAYLGTT